MFAVMDKELYPGSIFYVSSAVSGASDSAGYGSNPAIPYATIDYAIGKCTASAQDTIFVLPGHTESVVGATGCVMDVAGVRVIGIGSGSLQPKITFTTAAGATVSITAADCVLKNIHLLSNFTNGVTAGITLAATADGCVIDGIKFTETANTKEFLVGISIATDCDDVTIQNCKYCGIAGGTTSSIIAAAGGTDRTIIRDNYLHGDCSAAAVKLDAAASSDLQILNNRVINIDTAAGLGIDMHASCTGFAIGNQIANLKNTVVGISSAGMAYCENYASNALGASGIILPAVDT